MGKNLYLKIRYKICMTDFCYLLYRRENWTSKRYAKEEIRRNRQQDLNNAAIVQK